MADFDVVKIGDVAVYRREFIEISNTEEYKRCRVQLHKKGVVLRDVINGRDIKTKKQRLCKINDFIVAEMDAKFGGYGIIPEFLNGAIVSSHYYLFELNREKILHEYFDVLIDTDVIQSQIKAKGSTNYSRVSPTEVLNFEIPCPKIKFQKEIIKKYSSSKKTVVNILQESDNQQTLFKQLRQTILQEAVEGKLTAEWRSRHPVQRTPFGELVSGSHHAARLLEKIKAEKERLVKEGKIKKQKPLPPIHEDEKPCDLPAGWVWCRFGDLLIDTFYGPRFHKEDYQKKGIPTIRTTDIQSDKIILKNPPKVKILNEQKIEFYKLNYNDLLITRTGSIGEMALFKDSYLAIPSAYVIRCRFNKFVNPDYFYKVFRSPYIQNYFGLNKQTGTKPNINAKVIISPPVLLPPFAEQQAILEKVDKLMVKIDALEEQVNARKDQAGQLMQEVLREAFKGESNQDI